MMLLFNEKIPFCVLLSIHSTWLWVVLFFMSNIVFKEIGLFTKKISLHESAFASH